MCAGSPGLGSIAHVRVARKDAVLSAQGIDQWVSNGCPQGLVGVLDAPNHDVATVDVRNGRRLIHGLNIQIRPRPERAIEQLQMHIGLQSWPVIVFRAAMILDRVQR